MLTRLKLLTAAVLLLAAGAGLRPALAKTAVTPSSSMLARGSSVDGYWETDTESWWWSAAAASSSFTNGCSYCLNDSDCECFYADGDGGNGIFQVNINQYTTMNWSIELDYVNTSCTDGGAGQPCCPASGTGEAINLSGNTTNTLSYSTTGQICNTATGDNSTYTGSFIITAGTGLYLNYQGAGTIGLGLYGNDDSGVNNQIEFNGNISKNTTP